MFSKCVAGTRRVRGTIKVSKTANEKGFPMSSTRDALASAYMAAREYARMGGCVRDAGLHVRVN